MEHQGRNQMPLNMLPKVELHQLVNLTLDGYFHDSCLLGLSDIRFHPNIFACYQHLLPFLLQHRD